MTEPIFSIITVTRNNAAGLKLTAKSIAVQQDTPHYEWIVIDGASTDTTMEVIQEYLHQNMIYNSEPDDGIYDAMNKGIDCATGRYLWFLNAGDCLPDAYTLRDTGKEIRNNVAPEFIYGDARENGFIKRAHGIDKFEWGMFTHHQSMLYRRDKVGELRFDTDYKIAADYAFMLNFLGRIHRTHHFPRILCDFQSGGISQTNAEIARRENYDIRRDLLQTNIVKNKLILFFNAATCWLKQNHPWLYRQARIFSRK
jgi:putative colanic acid biosynthesis glycosyltransferase